MKLFDRSTKAGFTLVELIIVIAILAILAGIAIPVYSGYISKANEAADLVLLDAARTALGAASMEHGVDFRDIIVTLDVNASDHTIDGISDVTGKLDGFSLSPLSAGANAGAGVVVSTLAAHPSVNTPVQLAATTPVDALNASFVKFFGEENMAIPLKVMYAETIMLTGDGVISMSDSEYEDGKVTLTVRTNAGTATYSVTKEQIEAVNASTFGSNMSVGELMGDVGGMVDSLTNVLNSGAFVANALKNMGMDLDKMGIKQPYDNYKSELSNAVVLAVAGQVNEGFDTQIEQLMSDASSINGLMNTMKTSRPNQLVSNLGNITAFYAMATGFVNSDASEGWTTTIGEGADAKTYNAAQYYNYVNDQIAKAASDQSLSTTAKATAIMTNMASLSALMEDESGNFTTQYSNYISGTDSQLSKDATGFVQAMQTVSTNKDALITSGAVSNGFDSGVISNILTQILSTDVSDAGE